MASIQKTAKGYRAQIKLAGVRDSDTFPTRREAVEWAAKREAEIRDHATNVKRNRNLNHFARQRAK